MLRRCWTCLCVASLAALTGCATAVPPVEVTRFHRPALAKLTAGSRYRLAESAAVGIETTSYQLAVDREMRRLGFVPAADGSPAELLVRVAIERSERHESGPAPVSIGVGGGGGSRSGIGVGIGFAIGGGPRHWVDLALAVRIDDAASGNALWEGRAETAVPAKAPAAQPSLAAVKLTAALFGGFPGESGTTISVP